MRWTTTNKLQVYLDTVIASAIKLQDLHDPKEEAALEELKRIERTGVIEFRISREVRHEVDRTREPDKKARLKEHASELGNVKEDHRLEGFNIQDYGRYGFISSPLISDVVDESMFEALTTDGLKRGDAIHFVNAVTNKCDVFLTTDPDFMDRRPQLEAQYPPIRIMKPTELLAELKRLKIAIDC